MKRRRLALLLAACTAGAGCAKNPLPTYAALSTRDALNVVVRRGQSVQTVQAAASIHLTSAARSITLDGALCFEKPGHLRLRAWKFGQAVFDLTITNDGTWQYVPRDEAKASVPLTRELILKFLGVLLPTPTLGADSDVVHVDRLQVITSHRNQNDGTTETREYDRKTLTLRRFSVCDEDDVVRFTLDFADYELINNIVWPTHLSAVSGDGHIDVKFSDVEINRPLPPRVFTPPARAERLP